MNTTSPHARIAVLPAMLPLEPPCARCGKPHEPGYVSAFEMIEIRGRPGEPVCFGCAQEHYPDLLDIINARIESWPHDIFTWPALDQAWVVEAIQGR